MTASATDDRAHRPADEPANPIADHTKPGMEAEGSLTALLTRPAAEEPPRGVARAMEVPDVIGLDILDAHRLVRSVGLRLAVSVFETKLGPWGSILSQQPEPGASMRTGSRVHAVVAGRPHLTVPDVRGQRPDVALDALRRCGLEPIVTEWRASRTAEAGTVASTRPSAGTLVVDGSRVTLSISSGQPVRRRSTHGVAE